MVLIPLLTQNLGGVAPPVAAIAGGSWGGKQVLPADEAFITGTPGFGSVLRRYIPMRPWGSAAESVTGYAVKGGYGFPVSSYAGVAGPGSNATMNPGFGQGTNPDIAQFCLQRDTQDWQFGEVSWIPQLHIVNGTFDNDTIRAVGCCARVADGTYTTPGGGTVEDEFLDDVSGYFFMHIGKAGLPARLVLLEVTNGSVVLLQSVYVRNLPGGLANGSQSDVAEQPQGMRMVIEESGSNIRITCWRRNFISPTSATLFGNPGNGTGISEDRVFNTITVAPVTSAGRCGFGMQTVKTQPAGENTMLCKMFRVVDNGVLHSRDRFKRAVLTAGRVKSSNSLPPGNSLGMLFTGDADGARVLADEHYGHILAGASETIEIGAEPAGGTAQVPGWMMSTRPATSLQQHRSIIVTFLSAIGSIDVRAGIHLRGRFSGNGAGGGGTISMRGRDTIGGTFRDRQKQGYLCIIKYEPAGSPVWELEIRAHRRGGNSSSSYRSILIATVDLVAASVSVGTDTPMTLALEVRNFDNQQTFPAMRVKINGAVMPLVAEAVAGISVNDDWLLDSRTEASFNGLTEGLYLDVSAYHGTPSTALARFDTWTEETLSEGPIAEELDEASIVLDAETVNLTGTLSTPLSWPVELDPGGYERMIHRFETGHSQTFPRSRTPRREWTVSCEGATRSERAALQSFFRSHKGVEIPFNWVRPSQGELLSETVKVRLLDDSLAHVLDWAASTNSEGYELRLGEVFDAIIFNENN